MTQTSGRFRALLRAFVKGWNDNRHPLDPDEKKTPPIRAALFLFMWTGQKETSSTLITLTGTPMASIIWRIRDIAADLVGADVCKVR